MAGVFLAFVVVSRTTAELKLAGIALKRLKMFTLYGDVVLYDQRVRELVREARGGTGTSRDRRK